MRQDRKIEYLEKSLERLRKENSEYESVNKALTKELNYTKRLLEEADAAYGKLSEQYDRLLFENSERAESLYEAQAAYEEALAQIRAMMKEYDAQARSLLGEMKRTGKAV